MTDILSVKGMIQRATLLIPKGMNKNAVSISFVYSGDSFIGNENIIFKERKTKGYKPSKLGG